jgi:hypothetical protein
VTFIINLFGIGIRYWVCDIPMVLFEEMELIRINLKVEWEELLFDFDFLQHFGFSHWSELSQFPEKIGFLLDSQNRIEIKHGAKFVARFRSHELLNYETLFPLFRTNHSEIIIEQKQDFRRLILIQYEKGLVGKYKIPSDFLNMNEVEFHLKAMNGLLFLSEITYQKQSLKSTGNDTLCFSSKVFEF